MKSVSKTTKGGPAVSELVQKGLRAHRAATKKIYEEERRMGIRRDPLIISAIRDKAVLKFVYNGERRVVEPQTYGLSNTGKEVLRAYQTTGGGRTIGTRMAKVFDVAKIRDLERTSDRFAKALSAHNPDDSAMLEVFATLPKPKP